jgi:hypothetical protein
MLSLEVIRHQRIQQATGSAQPGESSRSSPPRKTGPPAAKVGFAGATEQG